MVAGKLALALVTLRQLPWRPTLVLTSLTTGIATWLVAYIAFPWWGVTYYDGTPFVSPGKLMESWDGFLLFGTFSIWVFYILPIALLGGIGWAGVITWLRGRYGGRVGWMSAGGVLGFFLTRIVEHLLYFSIARDLVGEARPVVWAGWVLGGLSGMVITFGLLRALSNHRKLD